MYSTPRVNWWLFPVGSESALLFHPTTPSGRPPSMIKAKRLKYGIQLWLVWWRQGWLFELGNEVPSRLLLFLLWKIQELCSKEAWKMYYLACWVTFRPGGHQSSPFSIMQNMSGSFLRSLRISSPLNGMEDREELIVKHKLRSQFRM